MHITYLHQHFRTPAMNGGTRSYEFARRLADRGHLVHVITADPNPTGPGSPEWRTTEEAGFTVHWAAVPYGNTMTYRQRLAAFGRFARLAGPRAAALHGDVVFATSTPLTIAIPGVQAARRNKVPFVLEVRDVWPEAPIAVGALPTPPVRWAARRLEAWAYSNADQVIALSPDMATSIRDRHPGTDVTVIPNACDTDLFSGPAVDLAGKYLREETPWLGGRPLVLYAGTLGLVNGVSYLVRMAERLQHVAPEVRIAIIGGGREHTAVRDLATAAGVLNRNLFMLDPMPKTQVAAWFNACDLSCSTVIDVPALAANSANKVFDALAAGRPVAVNHGGWIADVITRAGAGLVWPARDPAAAADMTAAFLTDPHHTAAARYAARDLAATRFSREHAFDELHAVLTSAAGRGTR